MTIRNRLVPLALASAIAQILSQQTLAADAAPTPANDPDSLTQIVVTAEKREESLQNVPMSISAVTGTTLDNLELHSFADYAAQVPGLSLNNSRPGFTTLTLRGQNAGGVGSTVAVYLDESPFGSSSALLNGSILSGDFDTWDLQRVEVLRGPQGTLYGANSEGGLLKFVTTAPQLNTFSGAAEVTGEGIANGSNGGAVRAVVNLPIGTWAAVRLSGFDQDLGGFIDDPLRGKKDVNDGHKYGGRASLLMDPIDSLSIRLTATSQESRFNGTNAVDVDPNTLAPTHGDLTTERYVAEPSSFKYSNYNATITWDAGPFSVLSNTAYGLLNSDTITDDSSAIFIPPTTTLSDLLTGILGQPLGAYLDNRVNLSKFTQEVRLSSPSTQFFEWQVGGYFTHEIGHLMQHLNGISLPGGGIPDLSGVGITSPNLELVSLDSTYKEYAGFANFTFHIIPQFDISAGGRYSKNEQTANEAVSGPIATPQAFGTPSEGHVLTWSFSPRWHITDDTMMYARAATGYRPGGPNALPPAAPPAIEREYNADRTTNLEVGLRSTMIPQLSIDVDYFHVGWKDIQLLEIVDNFGINGNGGKASSQGVEWTFGWRPIQGLTFQWGGAYTNAKLTTPAPDVGGNDGDRLPYAPRFSTTFDGEYTWPVSGEWKGFLGGTFAHVGGRATDFGSAPSGTEQVILKHYDTVAARVGFDSTHYRVTLFTQNLTDSRGITNYTSSGALGLQGTASVITPRTVGVTLNAKF
jgi:iron complex outermembrane recepter protein